MILEDPLSTQNNSLDPEPFKCRPFRLRYLLLIILLWITEILRFRGCLYAEKRSGYNLVNRVSLVSWDDFHFRLHDRFRRGLQG